MHALRYLVLLGDVPRDFYSFFSAGNASEVEYAWVPNAVLYIY